MLKNGITFPGRGDWAKQKNVGLDLGNDCKSEYEEIEIEFGKIQCLDTEFTDQPGSEPDIEDERDADIDAERDAVT